MPEQSITNFLLLPELKLTGSWHRGATTWYQVEKTTEHEVCPKCATQASTTYDRRKVHIKDEPIRGTNVILQITKRRFWCKPCSKPFTEPIPGISKGYRTTARYRRSLLWACKNFTDLKRVRKAYRCSHWLIYEVHYEQLELERRKHLYPWPKTIGIDEHAFKRNARGHFREFVTVVVDYKHKRMLEVVEGKTGAALRHQLRSIPGRDGVKHVLLDLSDGYKSFARDFFPHATLIADKFHVLRLLNPSLNKYRAKITGDKRMNPLRWLLLKNGHRLEPHERRALSVVLEDYPELRELYVYKEALHRLYRTRGKKKAARALTKLCDAMAFSKLKEIKRLRRTLIKWREEVLAYFETRLTNARTESINNLAKLVQRRAFGYKNFKNYRLKLLNTYG